MTSSPNPKQGCASYTLSPSTTRIDLRSTNQSGRPALLARPACCSASINGAALPSMIGGSGPSISIRRSSISRPPTAASTCSTVWSAASPVPSWVRRSASTATSTCAGMGAVPGRSTRRKTIPVPEGAGLKTSRQGRPKCSPTPSTARSPAMVRRPRPCTGDRPRAAPGTFAAAGDTALPAFARAIMASPHRRRSHRQGGQ